MKRYGLFKKIKLFFSYRRTVLDIEETLERELGARVDRAYRIYTVVNIPKIEIDEPYNLRKSDIDRISERYLKDFSNKISSFLNSKGLMEMYDIYDINKVDKYSYLVVIGFSIFRTDKVFRKLLFRWLPISLFILLSIIMFLSIK